MVLLLVWFSKCLCVRQLVVWRDAWLWLLMRKRGFGHGDVVGGLQVDEVARIKFEEASKADGGVQ